MVQSDSVRSKAGQQGRMRDEKPIWRADDRLSQTTQPAWERSRNNIRSQQVHDLTGGAVSDNVGALAVGAVQDLDNHDVTRLGWGLLGRSYAQKG